VRDLLNANPAWLLNDDHKSLFITQTPAIPASLAPAFRLKGSPAKPSADRKTRNDETIIFCSENNCFYKYTSKVQKKSIRKSGIV
jgi:hypothetical protein